MARAGFLRTIAALAVSGLTFACGPGESGGKAGDAGLRLSFEDREEPGVFRREGVGRRDPAGEAEGLWAVVPGLPRPERALVENLANGDRTVVALFAGRGDPADVRLSDEAAEALGIGDRPARVRVTALRAEPQIVAPRDGF
jgi:hypothetical protein